jgi:hypothetical protein
VAGGAATDNSRVSKPTATNLAPKRSSQEPTTTAMSATLAWLIAPSHPHAASAALPEPAGTSPIIRSPAPPSSSASTPASPSGSPASAGEAARPGHGPVWNGAESPQSKSPGVPPDALSHRRASTRSTLAASVPGSATGSCSPERQGLSGSL